MDLISTNDAILVRNCALVQARKIKLEKKPGYKKELEQFEKLIEYLTYPAIQFEKAKALLNCSISPFFTFFANQVKELSDKNLVQNHLKTAESMLHQSGNFSQDKFNELKNAFLKRVNERDTVSSNLSHTRNTEPSSATLDSIKELENMLNSFAYKSKEASAFKKFCTDYSSSVLGFSYQKFKNIFDSSGKDLSGIEIAYDYDDYLHQIYSMKFKFNAQDSQQPDLTYQEPVSYTNNYFKAICHAYLISDKFANKSIPSLKTLSEDQISEIADSLSADYKYIKDFSKCDASFKFDDKGQIERMFFSINTSHTPEKTTETPIERNSINVFDEPEK